MSIDKTDECFNWSIDKIYKNQRLSGLSLWWPYLLTDRDKRCNLYREPSIDASYQVSIHLAEGFQRRRLKCEKLTDDRPVPIDGKSSPCFWQGELKKKMKPQFNKSKIYLVSEIHKNLKTLTTVHQKKSVQLPVF